MRGQLFNRDLLRVEGQEAIFNSVSWSSNTQLNAHSEQYLEMDWSVVNWAILG